MIIDDHTALIVCSWSLWFDIIFGIDFLGKCRFHFDFDNYLFCWMEHDIPLCNAADFFTQLLFFSIHTNLTWTWRQLPWGGLCWLVCHMHPWCKIWTGQHARCCLWSILSLAGSTMRCLSCFNIKNYLMAPWGYNYTKRFALNSNLVLSWCITILIMFLMCTDKLSKRNSISWLNLVSLNHVGPLNGRPQPSLFQKRMGDFNKPLFCVSSTKLSDANNIPSYSLQIC